MLSGFVLGWGIQLRDCLLRRAGASHAAAPCILATHPSVDAALPVRHRGWFELPAMQVTDEVKRDLRLLHLRSALDPKRFYKGFDQTKFPKYFQLGTVVEGAADFYSGVPPLQ